MTGNAVIDLTGDYRVCAGAFTGADPNVFYGSYFCANGSACHDYNTLLYPAAHNGESFAQTLYGVSSFGSDMVSDCPRGGAAAALSELAAVQPQQGALLAVLRQPATAGDAMSAAELRHFRPLVSRGAVLSDARAFGSRYGRGWVLPIAGEDRICLAVPDKVPGYGFTCASITQAVQTGLAGVLLPGPGGASRQAVFAAVLPDDSQADAVDRSGRRVGLSDQDGVVSTTLDAAGSVELRTPFAAEPAVMDVSPVE